MARASTSSLLSPRPSPYLPSPSSTLPSTSATLPITSSLTPPLTKHRLRTTEESLRISGAILHLIDKRQSIELAYGDLTILCFTNGDSPLAVLIRVSSPSSCDDAVQWPLTVYSAVVKLDDSHYIFTLRVPNDGGSGSHDHLSYGLTIASNGQEGLLKVLDGILENYGSFSVQKVARKEGVLDGCGLGQRRR